MILVAFAAALLAIDTPAEGGAQPAAAPPAAQAPKPAKPRQICHYEEITGSRTPKRICVAEGAKPAADGAGEVSSTIMKGQAANINSGARQ